MYDTQKVPSVWSLRTNAESRHDCTRRLWTVDHIIEHQVVQNPHLPKVSLMNSIFSLWGCILDSGLGEKGCKKCIGRHNVFSGIVDFWEDDLRQKQKKWINFRLFRPFWEITRNSMKRLQRDYAIPIFGPNHVYCSGPAAIQPFQRLQSTIIHLQPCRAAKQATIVHSEKRILNCLSLLEVTTWKNSYTL